MFLRQKLLTSTQLTVLTAAAKIMARSTTTVRLFYLVLKYIKETKEKSRK